MDKTKNISLGGFSFLIEENAYTALSQYLTEVRQHLQHNSDRDEIIFDVEQRMAELLKDRTANREVIIHQDVLYLIEVLGKPEQYVEDEDADKATNAANEASAQAFSTNKPLYRDIDDRKIGGVLSGLAHYFNISPTMLRIAFTVIFTLFFMIVDWRWLFPFNFISWAMLALYILFWIIVPAALTTAQKLEMQGAAVTLDSLASYKSSSTTSTEWHKSYSDKILWGVIGGLAQYTSVSSTWLRLIYLLLILVCIPVYVGISIALIAAYLVLTLLLKPETVAPSAEPNSNPTAASTSAVPKSNPKRGSLLLTVILVILALPLLFSLIAVIMGIFGLTSASGLSLLLLDDYLPFMISSPIQRFALYSSVFLLLLVPLSLLILVVVRLSYKRFRGTRVWAILTFIAFIAALIGLIISVGGTAKEFFIENNFERKINIPTTADTLYISIKTKSGNSLALTVDADTLLVQRESYLHNILPTNESEPYLLCRQTAMGRTRSQAAQNAKNIRIPLEIKDNHIAIPEYYEIIRGNTYRGQNVYYQLYLPVGKYIRNAKSYYSPYNKATYRLKEDGLYLMTKDSLQLVN
ncbi:PspC domain-containing protein [Capnocytophaga leadbetteri]|uniref:PspC domain-containing protein n=1 Tax=Capnocytophaga leadbetteri TaxID=327575 RepID=UPI0026EDA455|nr:PspC domain-containing protein [Capnocytophaga leadbetteri]